MIQLWSWNFLAMQRSLTNKENRYRPTARPSESGTRSVLTFGSLRNSLYRATTFSISARNSAYGSAPGWYMATFPVRSSSTSVGVVEAP